MTTLSGFVFCSVIYKIFDEFPIPEKYMHEWAGVVECFWNIFIKI